MFDFFEQACYNYFARTSVQNGGLAMRDKTKEKLEEILEFIKKESKKNGFPPTVREIGKAVGLSSSSTVQSYINKLVEMGLVKKSNSKTRTISVTESKISPFTDDHTSNTSSEMVGESELAMIPVVGKVAAGCPILAEENIVQYFPIPKSMISGSDVFYLQVQGDSMYEVGILDGDYVLVRQQKNANNGEYVVALINDSATVKTFYRENGYIRLQPENPFLEPIICKNEITLVGKVIGVFRQY